MIHLIQNEWMKIVWKLSTWIMVVLLLIGIIGVLIFTLSTQTAADALPSEEEWKSQLQQENESRLEEADRTDPTIVENQYRIENNIPPAEAVGKNVWSFIDRNEALIQLVGVFVIIMAATIVSTEFKNGTIKLLLIRPPTRLQVLMSKYITVILYALFLMALLFSISFILGAIFFGFQQQSVDLIYQNGEIVERSKFLSTLIQYGTSSINFIMLGTLAFAISTIFRSDSMAIAISIIGYIVGSTATGILLAFFDWAKYLLFANTDLSQYYTSDGPLVEGMTLPFSIAVLIAYWLLFMGLSVFLFQKREVKTGS